MHRRHLPILLAGVAMLAMLALCGVICLMAIEAHQNELALLSLLPLLATWFIWERLKARLTSCDTGNGPVIVRDPQSRTHRDEFLHFHDAPGQNGQKGNEE